MSEPETNHPQSRKHIFSAEVEMTSAEERADYLDRACGKDSPLRREIEKLLANHLTTDSFMETPANDLREGPGTQIGHYKLLEKIGAGTFGDVYTAHQDKPFERKVALKILKLGMNTREILARFEAERQALALMEDQNIAKIYDAGNTESGRPYFVMELIEDVSITQFCNEGELSIPQRLEPFIQVCSAIQHAHQKGVIHRNIKSTNILVKLDGDRPVPVVIDFGIAKAIEQPNREKTLNGHLLGTLAYMSPEQAGLNKLDIDTRSDIDSLGVLLYELLTGDTPLSKESLLKREHSEVLQMIREVDPSPPSARLSSHERK